MNTINFISIDNNKINIIKISKSSKYSVKNKKQKTTSNWEELMKYTLSFKVDKKEKSK